MVCYVYGNKINQNLQLTKLLQTNHSDWFSLRHLWICYKIKFFISLTFLYVLHKVQSIKSKQTFLFSYITFPFQNWEQTILSLLNAKLVKSVAELICSRDLNTSSALLNISTGREPNGSLISCDTKFFFSILPPRMGVSVCPLAVPPVSSAWTCLIWRGGACFSSLSASVAFSRCLCFPNFFLKFIVRPLSWVRKN